MNDYNQIKIFIEGYALSLEPQLKDYLNEIPENMIYSILPLIRWQYSDGDYKSTTISKSIKVTRFTSCSLLAERIVYSLHKILNVYKLQGTYMDLLIMGRP
jgi:hypothetical protein